MPDMYLESAFKSYNEAVILDARGNTNLAKELAYEVLDMYSLYIANKIFYMYVKHCSNQNTHEQNRY